MANQFLSLSLFIMLLSFFIILNAVSTFESVKSRPVLNSISLTFSSDEVEKERNKPSNFVEANSRTEKQATTLDKLEGLFDANIVGVKIRKNRLGTVMQIRMGFDEFSRAVELPAQATGSFVPTLVSLIRTRDGAIPYRMDMILNVDPKRIEKADQGDLSGILSARRNITRLSQKLESKGVEKKLMSAGLGPGEDGMVDIVFRRYEAFNPLKNNTVQE